MPKKNFPKFVIPLVLLILAAVIYFVVIGLQKKGAETLVVSGTIEAVSSVVSPEISGKVTEVLVNEGDAVKAGDPLFKLDDTLLQAQRDVAEANLALAQSAQTTAQAGVATAQTNFDLILAAALQESAALRAADWQTANPEGYTLPGGSFTPAELITAAQLALNLATSTRITSEMALADIISDEANADFIAAENQLLESKFEFQAASDVLAKANTSNNSELKDDAQVIYDDALAALQDAQIAYDDLKDTNVGTKILLARRDLVLRTEIEQAAESRLASLQTGGNSLKVLAAQAALQQAQAAADQTSQSVAQAEASLALLDVQISKLTVTAPADGVVLTRAVELGEVVSAGSSALTIGQLDPLLITVYVPEDQVGLLLVGQIADLAVDSFPGETFEAHIVQISDEAEFTPRNVQTVEGRKTTVFAVKLQLDNPDGKLKPGMPADVTFGN